MHESVAHRPNPLMSHGSFKMFKIFTSDHLIVNHGYSPSYVSSSIVHITVSISPCWGHGGRVVTLSPPTSEAGVRFPARPQVGNLVVACRWSTVYSTEP